MGKGGRCPETRAGRYARCETPKPSWGSSARGGTLESRVLRKAHARFGEERMEKCSRSNSPAAYSTSTTAARRGTSSPIGPGSSCPSDCATGLTGSDQWDLVLARRLLRYLSALLPPDPPEMAKVELRLCDLPLGEELRSLRSREAALRFASPLAHPRHC